jgi:hypothetical protein
VFEKLVLISTSPRYVTSDFFSSLTCPSIVSQINSVSETFQNSSDLCVVVK